MQDDPRLWDVFMDVQAGLPRQGPGDAASTRRAWDMLGLDGAAERVILDLGCGPGAQTLALAEAAPGARILALDLVESFIETLRARAAEASLADRIEARVGDMAAPGVAPESVDVIWSEGAAYNIGVDAALASWRPLLKPGGGLVFSELVWLTETPPATVAAFWAEEYPAMRDVPALRRAIAEAGYEPVGDFTLPDAAWLAPYYDPLEAKLPALRARYAGDAEALAIVEQTAEEIAMRRAHPDVYGYQMMVARRGGAA